VYFDKSYDGNILVNAFALGVCKPEEIVRAVAKGVGNLIVYLGAKTGRDGIHGATMASASFGEDIEEKRPTVQVGDPFKEKLLLEACMEMFEARCLVGIQDMGAAGLSSSSSEMAARGGMGMEIDTAKVPARETGMTPYEFMLSESQERMLICCTLEQLPVIERIAYKWDIDCAVIGKVTETERLVVRHGDVVAADVPVKELTDNAPLYERPHLAPPSPSALDLSTVADVSDVQTTLLRLLGSANLCSRRWVYRQYDSDVGTMTTRRPDAADAGVVMLAPMYPGRKDALAMTVDCNSRYVKADPFEGGKQVALECYRNLAATGATGLAITDCLNFGSPEDPLVMGEIALVCDGLAAAARALDTPVISGNVSLYNQTGDEGIDPTPTVGMVGQIADASRAGRMAPRAAGLDVWFFGHGEPSLAQSEWLFVTRGEKRGKLPAVDMLAQKAACDAVRGLWEQDVLDAAHDVAEGGVLVAAAEMVLGSCVGIRIEKDLSGIRKDVALFGEHGARFVLVAPASRRQVLETLGAERVGVTTEAPVLEWSGLCAVPVAAMRAVFEPAMERIAEGKL
jgi:phosphoribosylformylglycinamidine synthase II